MHVKIKGRHSTSSSNSFFKRSLFETEILKKKNILVHVPKSDFRSAQINTSTLLEKYDLNLFNTVHFLTQ